MSLDRFQTDLVARGEVLQNGSRLLDLGEDEPLLLTRSLSRSLSTPCLSPEDSEADTGGTLDTSRGVWGLKTIGEGSTGHAHHGTPASQTSSCSTPRAGDNEGLALEMVCRTPGRGPRRTAQELLVAGAMQGVKDGTCPRPLEEGLGGSYLFFDASGAAVGVLKPSDEEPLAPNNPKGFAGRSLGQPGLKRAIRVGEAALREVAAFLLDHGGFANVPCTALVRTTHAGFNPSAAQLSPTSPLRLRAALKGSSKVAKLGSFQKYVPHTADANDFGAARFPVAGVHRIGILDLRLLNIDRHAGNILVREPVRSLPAGAGGCFCECTSTVPGRGGLSAAMSRTPIELTLIPIDHGYCLPEVLEDPYFEWLHWPQASLPFSAEELTYIAALDADADVLMLRRELPMLRTECLRVLTVTTTLLKASAAAAFSLAAIGQLMTRPTRLWCKGSRHHEVHQSPLERLCEDVVVDVLASSRMVTGGNTMSFGTTVDQHASLDAVRGALGGSLMTAPLGQAPIDEEALFDFDDEMVQDLPPTSVHCAGPTFEMASNAALSDMIFEGRSTAMDVPMRRWRSMGTNQSLEDLSPEEGIGIPFGGVRHPQVSLATAAQLGDLAVCVGASLGLHRGKAAGNADWLPGSSSHATTFSLLGEVETTYCSSRGVVGDPSEQQQGGENAVLQVRGSPYVNASGVVLFGALSEEQWVAFRRKFECRLPAFLAIHAGVNASVLGAVPLSTSLPARVCVCSGSCSKC